MDYEPSQADLEDLEASQAYQQSLDEERESLSIEERKEEILWRAMNALKDAVAFCGAGMVIAEISKQDIRLEISGR